MSKDSRDWSFALSGDDLAFSGVKVPALLSAEEDEQILERLTLLEELEGVMDDLYKQFILLRLDEAGWGKELKGIQEWVQSAE